VRNKLLNLRKRMKMKNLTRRKMTLRKKQGQQILKKSQQRTV
jgi:hypothetical protein